VASPSPPPTAPPPACSNTCWNDSDGSCDDGGPGHEYSICGHGTDCDDCSVTRPRALARYTVASGHCLLLC
jgi:hypothetical protein